MKRTIEIRYRLTWVDQECDGLTEDQMIQAVYETIGDCEFDEDQFIFTEDLAGKESE